MVPSKPRSAPRCVGEFELLEEIGCGGMGIVYRARQRSLDRDVAVKMILAGRLASDKAVEHFRREGQTAARLHHRNIVREYQVRDHAGRPYLVMEFVQGKNLTELVRERPLPAERAARYVCRVARAMDYAHRHRIFHRDLKPANVLIDADDEPVITDFGLAKRMELDANSTRTSDRLGTLS